MRLITCVPGACLPSTGDTAGSTCLAQVTLPAGWWPALTAPDTKVPRVTASLYYSLESGAGAALGPPTPCGAVSLATATTSTGYQQLAAPGDELLHLLVPNTPLYPASRLYVPVFLDQPQVRHKNVLFTTKIKNIYC